MFPLDECDPIPLAGENIVVLRQTFERTFKVAAIHVFGETTRGK
jgi:hypothetical protein